MKNRLGKKRARGRGGGQRARLFYDRLSGGAMPPVGATTANQVKRSARTSNDSGFLVAVFCIAETRDPRGPETLDCDTLLYGEPSGGLVKTRVLRDPDGKVIQLDQRVQSRRWRNSL